MAKRKIFYHNKRKESCGIHVHIADKMQSFSLLNMVVHIVMTVLYRIS
jgi:hypothetical protein